MPGAGHVSILEAVEVFNGKVRNFLKELIRRGEQDGP